MNARLSFVHALSPLHAGVGQGAGVIDLPIARERATGLPFLPGSSIKGALRTRAFTNPGTRERIYTYLFGPKEIQETDNRASMIQVSDHRLLLLPVRSLAGTFAWVCSPYVLRRLARDLQDVGLTPPAAVPIVDKTHCLIDKEQAVITLEITRNNTKQHTVCLEDLELMVTGKTETNTALAKWARWIGERIFPQDSEWRTMLQERCCLVHDDVFQFRMTTSTEITARIRLQEQTKTVVDGGLWYEEALPAETILVGLMLATPHTDEQVRQSLGKDLHTNEIFQHLATLGSSVIQLGGKATVGRGLCRVGLVEPEQKAR